MRTLELPAVAGGKLVARFVDVGQGDGNVVVFPDEKTLLIDTGAEGTVTVTSDGNVISVSTEHRGKVKPASESAGASSSIPGGK